MVMVFIYNRICSYVLEIPLLLCFFHMLLLQGITRYTFLLCVGGTCLFPTEFSVIPIAHSGQATMVPWALPLSSIASCAFIFALF